MNETFDRLHRTLGRATAGMLIVVLVLYGVAIAFALLGVSHVATSLGQASLAFAVVFAGLFVAFLVSSLAAGVLRFLEHRDKPTN